MYDPEKALALQLRQPYANSAEAANDYLGAVGIRAKLRPLERGALNQQFMEKKLRNIIQAVSGSFGNAATRFETFVVKGGTYIYECYPDLDAMFEQQAVELDRGKRAEILARMQQILYETGDRHASRSLPSSMASDLGSASPISTGSQSSRIRRRMKTWR